MSTSIDQHVVEMRFDNKHFESNVATTMSTLDKLKHALHLDGASKGLENVNTAAKKVDMNGLSSGVETVRAKFSALEVIAVTALANITNSAVNAGKRIVSALTIDPVKTGFQEYEMKMDSIKTIVNSTGRELKDVNKLLEELNEYSDQTIYSFRDMTQNIGKFTNAGVGLEDAVLAIKGISNEAAVSGASAAEASRAMYNFSQALSSGYVKLIDWKSIENANMATKEFKQQLIDTAVELGVVTKQGDMYTTSSGKSFNATKNFNDVLQEQWMTTDVLITTLGKYADANTDIGKKAFAAAQEVTKMTQMWDVLKETAQSGWARTWELIVGDLNSAKKIFTPLTNFFSGIIDAMSDARNRVLDIALNFSKYWDGITSKIDNVKKAVDGVDKIADKLKYFQDVVTKVWRGDFNNQGDNPDRRDLLKAAGYDDRVVQDLVNKGYKYKLTIEDIEASHKKFGLTMESTTKGNKEVVESLKELDEETLKNLGLTEDEIELYKALDKEAKRTGKTISKIADDMSKNNGRDVLIESFKNFGTVIVDTVNIIKSSLAEIFEIPTTSDIAVRLHGMIMALREFSESIQLVDKKTGELTDTGKKFLSIFKGVFAAVDIAITLIKGPAKLAFNILKEILSFFGVNVLDVLADVGEGLVSFRDNVDKVVDTITKFVVENVAKWIEKFKETEFFKTVAGWFKDLGDSISNTFDNISGKVNDFKLTGIGKAVTGISNVFTKIGKSKLFTTFVDGITGAFTRVKEFFGNFKLPKLSIDNLSSFFQNFVKIGEEVEKTGGGGISGVLSGVGQHMKENEIKWNWDLLKEKALEKFVTFFLTTGDKIKKAFEKCKEIAGAIKKFLFGTEEVNLPLIMDTITKFLWMLTLIKTIQLLDTMVSPFDNITNALNNFATSLKWDAISGAFKSLALALAVFTVCILIISSMDAKAAWNAAGILMALMVVMGAVVTAMGIVAGKAESGLNTAGAALSLLMLVGSIAILIHALKEIDKLTLDNPGKTVFTLIGVLVGLTIAVRAISKAGGASFRSVASILTLVGALKLILEVIKDYDEFDWTGKSRAIEKMVEMMLALAVAIRIMSGGVKAGASASGVALALFAMIIGLKVIISAIEDLAEMDEEVIKKGGRIIAQILTLMTIMLAVANLTNKGTILEKGQKSVNNFTGFAIALLAVVGAIWFLGKMDIKTLEQGGQAVGKILGLMTVMLFALGKSCGGLKTGPIIAMLIGFGLLMAEMALLTKWLDDVSWESKVSAAVAIGGVLLAMAGVLRILTRQNINPKIIYKWIAALAVLGLVVAEIALVLYAIRDVDPLKMISNAAALSVLLLAMAGALWTLSKYDVWSGNLFVWIGAMAVLGAVVAELGAVLWGMSQLGTNNAIGNATALSELLVVMAGVLFVMSKLKNTGDVWSAIIALGALGLVAEELAIVLKVVEDIEPKTSLANATALSELLIVLTGVMAACAGLGKVVGSNAKGFWIAAGGIASLGLVVGELGYLLSKIKEWDMSGMESEVKVIAQLLIALTGVLFACSLIGMIIMSSGWDNIAGTGIAIGSLAALGLIIWELGAIVKSIKKMDIGGAESEVAMVTKLLYNLVPVLAACSIIGLIAGSSTGAILNIAALGLVILELGWVISLIKKMDISGMESEVEVLTKLLYNLVPVLAACTLLGLGAAFATGGIIALATLGLVVLELGYFLSIMKDWDIGSMMPTVLVLSVLLHNLVPVLAACTLLGIAAPAAIGGISAMAVLGLVVLELGAFLSLMKDWGIGSMLPTVLVLTTLLNNLVPVLAACTILGFAAPAAYAGIGALITMIGALEGAIVALGVVMSIPALQKFLDVGIAMLEKLAYGIGSIISKFAEGLTTGLPGIAQNLSDFATNLETFLDVMNDKVTDETVTKAGKLAEVVTALVGADFKKAITDIFGKDDSMANLGTQMSDFGNNIGDFIDAINAFEPESASNMEAFATAIQALNSVCGSNNFGDGKLENLGSQTASFAGNMKKVAESLSELTDDDVTNIKRAAEGAKAIADLNEYLPKSGGLWQDIAGSADIEDWGKKIEAFADSLVNYSIKVSGGSIDKDAIIASAEAAQPLADLTNSLGKVGGIWQEITGQSDLTGFGEAIVPFADDLIAYNNKIVGASLDVEAIKTSAEGAAALVEVANKLPKEGGWWQAITGAVNLESFGDGLSHLATGLVDYSAAATAIDEDKIEAIKNSGTAVDEIVKVVKKIPETGGTASWFGEHDPYAFGNGIAALATGLTDMCNAAAVVDETDTESIKAIGTAIDTIVPAVKKIPEDFDSAPAKSFKTAVTSIHDACKAINTISTAGYDYSGVEKVKTAITNITNIITTDAANSLKSKFATVKTAVNNVSSISKTIADLNNKSYGGVAVLKKALSELSTAKVQEVIDTFKGKASSVKAAIVGLVDAMEEGLSDVTSKTTIKNAMIALIDSGIEGLKGKAEDLKSAGLEVSANAVSGSSDQALVENMSAAGEDLGAGLVKGIAAKEDAAYAAGYRLGQQAVQGEKDGQKSKSPSKLTIQAGKWLGEGLIIGMDAMGSKVYNAGSSLGKDATSSLSSSISRISDMVSSDIDSQPTIRPVLDLSDVESGAATLGNMLNMNSSVGVRANLGAISSMMSLRGQNGGNSDVVSAIDKLSKKMDNMGNTTYHIDGVTYDDGSNVADAVGSLTRAIRMERRV